MATVMSNISLIVSTVSGIGTVGAWIVAWRAIKHAKTAAEANERLAAIEQRREHYELRPRFQVEFLPQNNSIGSQAYLVLTVTGPAGLNLDSVEIWISDTHERTAAAAVVRRLAKQMDEIDLMVTAFGPYEFVKDRRGRPLTVSEFPNSRYRAQAPRFALTVGGSHALAMEPTRAPHQSISEQAWREVAGSTIRLRIVATAKGHQPWTQHLELLVPRAGRSVV
ncbi:hypothetical protein [Dactylosporangium sp. CA-139066]|uniref:hypothetical protein n=1 Tax=Dactylosporangium sp. CA-139066 TaxID=3239930 RepID=UPI003D8BF876